MSYEIRGEPGLGVIDYIGTETMVLHKNSSIPVDRIHRGGEVK
jgi:hypothetical protein